MHKIKLSCYLYSLLLIITFHISMAIYIIFKINIKEIEEIAILLYLLLLVISFIILFTIIISLFINIADEIDAKAKRTKEKIKKALKMYNDRM